MTKPRKVVRKRYSITGVVQGVGFRPFVHRLATRMGIRGWVRNFPGGVMVDVESDNESLNLFHAGLIEEQPSAAHLEKIEIESLDFAGHENFQIRESMGTGPVRFSIPADRAPCGECLADMADPENRRHQYPFISCAQCGPRYSIIESLPFDRGNSTMRDFEPCDTCRGEYEDPADRRFHAQTISCADCGPILTFVDGHEGESVPTLRGASALDACARGLKSGAVTALKGVGAFQILVDPFNDAAVRKLRDRKHRPVKPFALACATLEQVHQFCEVSRQEAELLRSAAAPIVLLRRRPGGASAGLSEQTSPGNTHLGIMLPASPLHLLLLQRTGPLIMTSGNLSGEPPCMEEKEAMAKLADIADNFLVHDRRIQQRLDDSVVRVAAQRPLLLRRARGYPPLKLALPIAVPPTAHASREEILAAGAESKNAIAVFGKQGAYLGPYIGDLYTQAAVEVHREATRNFPALLGIEPTLLAHDMHPDYASTRETLDRSRKTGAKTHPVQHHYAHSLAAALDNRLEGNFLGIAWDGTGVDPRGNLWGGEFLRINADRHEPFARFLPFPLPGGEIAVHDIRRTAIGALHVALGPDLFENPGNPVLRDFSAGEQKLLRTMLERNINRPDTSSVGRLFDAVSALLGIRSHADFEGEAAIALEQSAETAKIENPKPYPFIYPMKTHVAPDGAKLIDWRPMLTAILDEAVSGIPAMLSAARFHETLARIAAAVALDAGYEDIVLCGGCFQNRLLLERTIHLLRDAGLNVFWSRDIPPGDGGLGAGQILAALRARVGRFSPAVALSNSKKEPVSSREEYEYVPGHSR